MSATLTPPRATDDPAVQAALDRISTVVQRALLRIEENRERAARRVAVETPPPKERAAAPLKAAAQLSQPSTATRPLPSEEGDRA